MVWARFLYCARVVCTRVWYVYVCAIYEDLSDGLPQSTWSHCIILHCLDSVTLLKPVISLLLHLMIYISLPFSLSLSLSLFLLNFTSLMCCSLDVLLSSPLPPQATHHAALHLPLRHLLISMTPLRSTLPFLSDSLSLSFSPSVCSHCLSTSFPLIHFLSS